MPTENQNQNSGYSSIFSDCETSRDFIIKINEQTLRVQYGAGDLTNEDFQNLFAEFIFEHSNKLEKKDVAEVINRFVKNAKVNINGFYQFGDGEDAVQETILNACVRDLNFDLVKSLLFAGADPRVENNFGQNALNIISDMKERIIKDDGIDMSEVPENLQNIDEQKIKNIILDIENVTLTYMEEEVLDGMDVDDEGILIEEEEVLDDMDNEMEDNNEEEVLVADNNAPDATPGASPSDPAASRFSERGGRS